MKIEKKLTLLCLVTILAIGLFFRFFRLGQTPGGLYLDEASIGYNAFSILKTGKDEYGKSFPLLFRSVGDFKTPVYIYLVTPLIRVIGLSPFSVRLPSAIFGFLTLIILYLLLRKIIKGDLSQTVSLLSTFFLAISPWHIVLSRTAYESTVSLFFLLLGIYLFIISLKKHWLYPLSAVVFGLSFISYHAERLLAPAVVVSLIIFYRKEIFTNISKKLPVFIISIAAGLFVVGPTTLLMRSPGFLKRASTLNIFSFTNQMPYGFSGHKTTIPNSIVYDNKYLLSAKELASLYVSYFSPRYLFSIGDSSPRSSYPGVGTFFVWQFPLYLLGLYRLVKQKNNGGLNNFILTLLFISPIPAALTRDPYSTIRSLPMLIPLVVILSLGAVQLLEITKKHLKNALFLATLVIILFSLVKLFVSVFYYNDYFRSENWSYGWREAVATTQKLEPKLPIVVDNSRGEPYINLLFFLMFDPTTYQQTNFEVMPGEYYNNLSRNPEKNIGDITVKKIDWGGDTDRVDKYLIGDTLTISDRELHNHRLQKVSDILYPDGTVAIRIVRTTPLKPDK